MKKTKHRATRGAGSMQRTDTGWRYRFQYELPDGTKKTKSVSGKTQAACRKAADEFRAKLPTMQDTQALRTLEDWGNVWLQSKAGTVAYGTYHNYEMYFRHHIVPALGKMPVSQITPIQIELLLSGKADLSTSARKAIRGVIVQIFRMLVRNNIVQRNPADSVDALASDDPDIRTFSIEDIAKIKEHAAINANGMPVLGMLYTGCRFEEIAALKWVDVNAQSIVIRRSIVRKSSGGWEVRETTKSGHDRVVGINQQLRQLLDGMPKDSDFVFPRPDGRYMTYDWYYPKYKAFLSGAGVPYLSMHKCRHTYATALLRGSNNFRIVQQALGHSDPSVTMRYTHPDEADQVAAAATLSY